MADPWAQFKDAPQDDPWAQFADADSPAQVSPPPESTGAMLRRELSPANLASAAVRPVVKAATAIPGIFADAGMAAWNLATGQNNQMPSQATSDLLDRFTRAPEGYGKGAEFVSTALLGSGIRAPQIGRQAPKDFVPPKSQVEQTFSAARKDGYVVPPSTIRPKVGTRLVETLGGKEGTAQDASIANQQITNRLARRALGLGDDAQLDRDVLGAIRANAAKDYEAVRSVGKITADAQYKTELSAIAAKFRGAAKDFPELAKSDVDDLVKGAQKESFDSDSAVDLISILRDKADTAYAQGNKGLGKAYRKVSEAIEKVIDRNLAERGEGSAGLLQAYRNARQLIAKTYSVQGALNESTGNVSALNLGKQLTKGKPLSGQLEAAGRFGQAFPRAAREVVDSGSVRNTDAVVAAVPAALSGQPWYLGYPFLRMGARNALLSAPVQNSLIRQAGGGSPRIAMGSAPVIEELNQLVR